MSSLKELQWEHAPATKVGAGRLVLAMLLHGASGLLAQLGAALTSKPALAKSDPHLEFHAEAGAPEGALYVDGRLVGWLPGVSRL